MAEPVAVTNVVNVEASSSNDTTEKSTNEKVTELATSLLAQGRRHLLVSDIPAAITALAESCRLLGELYGDFADECAESYYYYGMALLEMARTDSDVLGDAVEGGDKEDDESNDDDEDADEDDEEEEEAEGAEEKKGGKVDEVLSKDEEAKASSHESTNAGEGSSTSPAAEEKSEKTESEKPHSEPKPTAAQDSSADVEMKDDSPTDGTTTNGEAASNKAEDEASKSKETVKPKSESKGKSLKPVAAATIETKPENGDDGEDIADDVSNLQLAWEMFELAKKIYQRKAESDPSVMPKLADALIRLAEVAIESENYGSAIDDLKKCLEIQHASFPPDSRSLAETLYQLGVAYTFTTEFQEAIKNFESAAKVIELRIDNLKNPKERNPSMEDPKPFFHTIEGEIEELEALLPDIKEKIADTIDLEKEAARKVAENGINGSGPSSSKENGSFMEAEASSTNGKSPSSLKPATDISHLIRKKRKPEEQETEASAAKKVCAEPEAADAAAV